jgi:superkiller protein 3
MKKNLSLKQRKEINKIKRQALSNFRYKRAIEFYEKLLKRYNLSTKDLCDLGLFYDHLSIFNKKELKNKTKNEKKALSYYKKALQINPKELSAIEGIGRIWWHRKNKKAIEYYKKGLKLSQTPRQKSLFLECLGNINATLKQYKKAIKNYEEALEKSPISKVSIFNNLSLLYKNIGNLPKAKYYAKTALNLIKKRPREKIKTKSMKSIQKQLEQIFKNGCLN